MTNRSKQQSLICLPKSEEILGIRQEIYKLKMLFVIKYI